MLRENAQSCENKADLDSPGWTDATFAVASADSLTNCLHTGHIDHRVSHLLGVALAATDAAGPHKGCTLLSNV